MGEGVAAASVVRVRIKGHAASVVRFFFIAMSFMMAWVLISSELGYYSRWFGPQILLELNMAFYLPSIPVLIISGQVEKVLDDRLGPTRSMMIRLLLGLGGCTAVAAAFPFMGASHGMLLAMVAVLGTLSAIAFSTSYQLVQWFRHADIIALGIGGVGSGPLVLMLQLFLGVGASPHRWQWIAMFEVTAAIMAAGLVSATSLFAQYWKIMTGEEEYIDPRSQPLLAAAAAAESAQPSPQGPQAAPSAGAASKRASPFATCSGYEPFDHGLGSGCDEDDEEAEEEACMQLTKAQTAFTLLAPDPFHVLPVALVTPPRRPTWDEYSCAYDDLSPPLLHRANSLGAGPCTEPRTGAGGARGGGRMSASGAAMQRVLGRVAPSLLARSGRAHSVEATRLPRARAPPHHPRPHLHPPSTTHTPDSCISTRSAPEPHTARTPQHGVPAAAAARWQQPAVPGQQQQQPSNGVVSAFQGASHQALLAADNAGSCSGSCPDGSAHGGLAAEAAASGAASPATPVQTARLAHGADADSSAANSASCSPHPQCHASCGADAGVDGDGGGDYAAADTMPRMTVQQETIAVLRDTWAVVAAFLLSVTVLYLVFPFFTYVQGSGALGEDLPKILFFARIFADIVGRFAPRMKSLVVRAPGVLLSLATAQVVVACLFFVYIKAPDHVHHDLLSVAFIVFLWLCGGYINTSANILAPSLTTPNLVSRASALMALTFQVAHFAGLLLALMLAYLLYGDVVG